MGGDALEGDLFLFVNRRGNACKVLQWDRIGFCIFQKRLEPGQGGFAKLWHNEGIAVRLSTNELALFIEGCDLIGRRALTPAALVPKRLAPDRGV